jgi:predicted HTH domain antitoxin
MIVLELYRRGTISSGKAGELLGMPRIDFIKHASRLGIPFFDMTDDEWEAEKAALKNL